MESVKQNAKNLARLLKVLANEYRLMILCCLLEEPHTVSALGQKITQISPSALSQHLANLKANGIVDSIKKAQSVTYFIVDKNIRDLMMTLKDNYC
ncbi:MAG: ArsR/SmtB family transcription factor [Saccharofermentanales bacterium]